MITWLPSPRRRRTRHLAARVMLPLALALAAGTAAARLPDLALVNESSSLARGVYWRVFGRTPTVGAIVAVPQPASVRPYLAGLGVPQDMPLIKRVVAVGGETVCARNGALETPIGRYRVRDRDRTGRALPTWRGCGRLGSEELFLVGDSGTSFDSRYFGPVSRRDLLGVYRQGPSW